MSEVSSRLTLTSFVPRQVMLEMATNASAAAPKDDSYKIKKKRKDETMPVMEVEEERKKSKKKKCSKISNAIEDGSGSVEALALDRLIGDAVSQQGKGREDLIRSIAAFLEDSGFVKTLSVFRSEAQIEVNSRGGSCINLEDLFDKFIELSKRDPVASIGWSKEQDVQTKDKKRKIKQVSDSFGEENFENNLLDATLGTEENNDYGKPLKVEKKKKHKVIFGENMGEVACLNVEEVAKEKIEKMKDLAYNHNLETGDFEKDKCEKKKKKKKEAKQMVEQSDLGIDQKAIAKKSNDGGAYASTKHQESVNSDILVNDLPENVDGSRKDKKKHKNMKLEKSTSDSLHTHNSDKLVEETSDGVGKHDNDGLQNFDSRKDSIAISKENTADVKTSKNNKRKKPSSKETAIQVESITAVSKSKQTKPEVAKEEKETLDHKILTCSEPSPLKQESKEPSKALSSVDLDKHEENDTSQDPQKQLSEHQLANGGIEKHQKEGSTRPKSIKKEKHFDEMTSGGGDELPRRSFTLQVYRKTKLLVTKGRDGGREDSTTPPPSATPQIVPLTFPSSSQQVALPFPTTPGYYYYSGPPPSVQQHTGASTSQPPPDTPPTDEADLRILIAPEGDTFYPSSQPTHKVRDIIRSRFDAPYISWKKIPLNVRDMWFREFEKDFRWLPQHHDRVRKFFEKRGSTRMRNMFTSIRKKRERPLWIREDVWADLCAAWGTPEYVQKRAQNKDNCASDSARMGTSLHTGGSIPHAEHRKRLEKSLGRQPIVVEVHTRTHQRQETQEWITPKAQKVYEDYMKLSQSQGSAGEGASSIASCRHSDYELWTEAVGGIQKGRIYELGSEAGSYRSHAYTPTDVDIEERFMARLRDEIRAEVRADMAAKVDARFAEINENIRAGFERMIREMHQRREPPTEPADDETESDRDA